ncbi:MAG TPA: hypothetical protein VFE20_06615, partial [Thermoleophilia bacterium]|nr:hypothetical protein [Thermoleophilia bacterium]
ARSLLAAETPQEASEVAQTFAGDAKPQEPDDGLEALLRAKLGLGGQPAANAAPQSPSQITDQTSLADVGDILRAHLEGETSE